MVSPRSGWSSTRRKGSAPTSSTGPKLREALVAEPILSKETCGVLPHLYFTKEAPFPTKNLTVNIGTVENGKYVTAMKDTPVPELKKW
jgi:branched-chain amino acid transport system substrate-binding protein